MDPSVPAAHITMHAQVVALFRMANAQPVQARAGHKAS